jgi:hypothetical protein
LEIDLEEDGGQLELVTDGDLMAMTSVVPDVGADPQNAITAPELDGDPEDILELAAEDVLDTSTVPLEIPPAEPSPSLPPATPDAPEPDKETLFDTSAVDLSAGQGDENGE